MISTDPELVKIYFAITTTPPMVSWQQTTLAGYSDKSYPHNRRNLPNFYKQALPVQPAQNAHRTLPAPAPTHPNSAACAICAAQIYNPKI